MNLLTRRIQKAFPRFVSNGASSPMPEVDESVGCSRAEPTSSLAQRGGKGRRKKRTSSGIKRKAGTRLRPSPSLSTHDLGPLHSLLLDI